MAMMTRSQCLAAEFAHPMDDLGTDADRFATVEELREGYEQQVQTVRR